jgi:hypothetical protein
MQVGRRGWRLMPPIGRVTSGWSEKAEAFGHVRRLGRGWGQAAWRWARNESIMYKSSPAQMQPKVIRWLLVKGSW